MQKRKAEQSVTKKPSLAFERHLFYDFFNNFSILGIRIKFYTVYNLKRLL